MPTDETSEVVPFRPKVFISYTETDESHFAMVLQLAERLVDGDNIDVAFDKWDLKPGQDKHHFMELMVKDPAISKVLMICNEEYKIRADNRTKGAGEETTIITSEIYEDINQTKFIPIVAETDPSGNPFKPIYLKGRIHIDLSNLETFEENYERLVRDIYNKPLYVKPAFGKPPAFLDDPATPTRRTTFKLRAFKNAVHASKGTVVGLAEEFLKEVLEELGHFDLSDTTYASDITNFEARIYQLLTDALPLRDEYLEFLMVVSQYVSTEQMINNLHRFFENAVPYIEPRNDASNEALRFLIPELFLYTVAAWMRQEQFGLATLLVAQGYLSSGMTGTRPVMQINAGQTRLWDFGVFCPCLPELNRMQSQQGSYIFSPPTPAAKQLKERASHPDLTYTWLVEADYMLFIRHAIGLEVNYQWLPVTISSLSHTSVMPLFLKASSKVFFDKIKGFLGVTNREDFQAKIERMCDRWREEGWTGSFYKCDRQKSLTNVQHIAEQ